MPTSHENEVLVLNRYSKKFSVCYSKEIILCLLVLAKNHRAFVCKYAALR